MAGIAEHPAQAVAYGAKPAARTSGRRGAHRPRRAGTPASEESLPRRDLAEIRDLLQRKLAWYGLGSVKVGPLRPHGAHGLLVDLLHTRGEDLCCVEVDRESGAVRAPGGHVLNIEIAASAGAVPADAAAPNASLPRAHPAVTPVPRPLE